MSSEITGWAGLDVGDRYVYVHVLDEFGETIEETRFSNTRHSFGRWLKGHDSCAAVIETGTHSRWMALMAREAGVNLIVADARSLRLISESNQKSDVNDAHLLARLLRADPRLLSPVDGIAERDAEGGARVRVRDQLVRARTRLCATVRSLVRHAGFRLPSGTNATFHRLGESIPKELQAAMSPLMASIALLSNQIAIADREMLSFIKEQYPEAALLQTVPGIGPVTALSYLVALGDPKRFKKSRDVGAYFGLTPRRSQSGERDPSMPITKAGNPHVRRLLVMAAHTVLREGGKDSELALWGRKKAGTSRNAKKRTVVAVARKLSVLCHRILITGQPFVAFPSGPPPATPPLIVERCDAA